MSDILNSVFEDERRRLDEEDTRLRSRLNIIDDSVTPDDAAVIDRARRLQPGQAPAVTRQEADQAIRSYQADRALRVSPRLQRYLSEPSHAAMAQDDVQNLSLFDYLLAFTYSPRTGDERSEGWRRVRQAQRNIAGAIPDEWGFATAGRAAQQGFLNVERARIANRLNPTNREFADRPAGDIVRDWRTLEALDQVAPRERFTGLNAVAEQVPMIFGGVRAMASGALSHGARSWRQSMRDIGELPPAGSVAAAANAPFAWLGATVGGAVQGTVGFTYEQEAGAAFEEFSNLVDRDGNRMPMHIAGAYARRVGELNAVIEFVGLAGAAKLSGADELASYLSRPAIRSAIRRMGYRDAARRVGVGIAGAGLSEGLTELSQEGVTIALGQLAQEASGGEWEELTDEEIASRLWESFSVGATVGAVLGGIPAGGRFIADIEGMQAAQHQQEVFEALSQSAQDSKLRARSPTRYADAVDALTANGPTDEVAIDPDRFLAYFQERGEDAFAVADDLRGVGAQALREALESGVELKMPMGTYAAQIAATPHHGELSRHVRMGAGQMTPAEVAARFELGVDLERAVSEAQRLQKEATAKLSEMEGVRERIKTLFESADAYAEQATARFVEYYAEAIGTMATRAGMSPSALLDEIGLGIDGPFNAASAGEDLRQGSRGKGPDAGPVRSVRYDPPDGVNLSEREREFVELASNGASNDWIALEYETTSNNVAVALNKAAKKLTAVGAPIPWGSSGRGARAGIVSQTGEPTTTTEQLVRARESIRKAGGKGYVEMLRAIAERFGLQPDNVERRLQLHDRKQRQIALGADATDAQVDMAELRRRWVEEHVISQPVPGGAPGDFQHAFILSDGTIMEVGIGDDSNGAASIEWTFLNRMIEGVPVEKLYAKDAEAFTLSQWREFAAALHAIIERDIETYQRPAYVFDPYTEAHARTYKSLIDRFGTFYGYTRMDEMGTTHFFHPDAGIAANGRIKPQAGWEPNFGEVTEEKSEDAAEAADARDAAQRQFYVDAQGQLAADRDNPSSLAASERAQRQALARQRAEDSRGPGEGALEQEELGQGGKRRGPSGAIFMRHLWEGGDLRSATIKLFEGRDLSTPLHEGGHLFLEVLQLLAGREPAMPAAVTRERGAGVKENIIPSGVETGVAKPKADGALVDAEIANKDEIVKTSWGAELNARAGKDYILSDDKGDRWVVRADIFETTYIAAEDGKFRKDPDLEVGYWISPDARTIETLEGPVEAAVGDYVMVGSIGEMWPMKSGRFAQRNIDVPQPPNQLRDDWQTVLAWFGVTAEQWDAMTLEQKRPYHEQFARANEAYLMTAEAPSSALKQVFAVFKRWLTWIYKSVLALNVNLTPEIRAVFDRMLATDDAIEAVRAEQGAGPRDLIPREKFGGTDKQYERYVANIEIAREAALADLQKEAMGALIADRTRWWRSEEARARRTVEAEMAEEPVWRAYDALSGAVIPEGTSEPVRLSPAVVLAEYGRGVLDALPPEIARADVDALFNQALTAKRTLRAREPTRLTARVQQLGGVRDPGGDVKAIIGSARARPGLINNATGLDPDEMALRLWEEGYFGVPPGRLFQIQPIGRRIIEGILSTAELAITKNSDGEYVATIAPAEAPSASSSLGIRSLIGESVPGEAATQMRFTRKGKELRITWAGVGDSARGAGVGLWMYRSLIEWAFAQGYSVASDTVVSEDAQNVYRSLMRDYQIKQNDNTEVGDAGELRSTNKKPVFSVVGRNTPWSEGLFQGGESKRLGRVVIDVRNGDQVIINPTRSDILKMTRAPLMDRGSAWKYDSVRYIIDAYGNVFVGPGARLIHDEIASAANTAGYPIFRYEFGDNYGHGGWVETGSFKRVGDDFIFNDTRRLDRIDQRVALFQNGPEGPDTGPSPATMRPDGGSAGGEADSRWYRGSYSEPREQLRTGTFISQNRDMVNQFMDDNGTFYELNSRARNPYAPTPEESMVISTNPDWRSRAQQAIYDRMMEKVRAGQHDIIVNRVAAAPDVDPEWVGQIEGIIVDPDAISIVSATRGRPLPNPPNGGPPINWEDGLFQGERPTVREFLDKLEADIKGTQPAYSEDDKEIVAAREEAEKVKAWFGQYGIDLSAKDSDLRAEIAKIAAREDTRGIDPEIAASIFGFGSGEELLKALSNLRPKREVIQERTRQRMLQEYGDPFATGEVMESAMKAAHREAQAKVLEIELDAIDRAIGSPNARPVSRVAKDIAEEQIARMTVRQIRKYEWFLGNERRHAKEAMAALEDGDLRKARLAKHRQLVNFHLYRLAREAAQELDRAQRYFRKLETSQTVRGRIETDYLDQIDGLLEQYEFRKISQRTEQRRINLSEWAREMEAKGLGHLVAIDPRILSQAQTKPYAQMELDEVRALVDAVKNIEHLGRLKERLLDAADKRAFREVVSELADRMNETGPLGRAVTQNYSPTAFERAQDGMRKAHAEMTRMEFLFRYLDGGRANGPLWRALWLPFAKAADKESVMMRDAVAAMEEVWSSAYTRPERARMFKKRHAMPDLPVGAATHYTKAELLAIALNLGNEGNVRALVDGFNWGGGRELEAGDYTIAKEQILAALTRVLEPRDWITVQRIWDLIGTFRDEAFALQKDLTGIEPQAVESQPITLADGTTLKGGYYPLKFDRTRNLDVERAEAKQDVQEMWGSNWSKPMTRKGHLIERVGSGGRPIKLSLAVFSEHVQNVVHDIAYRRAVVDVDRIITDKQFAETFVSVAGRPMYDQLRPWLQAIAADRVDPSAMMWKMLLKLRGNVAIAAMGYRVSTGLQQLVGVLQAVPHVGAGEMANALVQLVGNPANIAQKARVIANKSEFMRSRMNTLDRDIRETIEKMERTDPLHPIRHNAFALVGMFDWAVSSVVWTAAYNKALEGKVDGIDSGDEAAAVAYGDQAVRTTQSAGLPQDLPAIMRGSEVNKLLTMFFSYFSVLYNWTSYDQVMGARKGRVPLHVFTANLALIYVISPLIAEALAGRWTPREDEDDEERNLRLAMVVAKMPFMTLPVIRDVANVVGTGFEYQLSPVGSAPGQIADAVTDVVEGRTFESEATTKRAVTAIGYAFGLPTPQAWITIDYLADKLEGEEEGFDPVEAFVSDRR